MVVLSSRLLPNFYQWDLNVNNRDFFKGVTGLDTPSFWGCTRLKLLAGLPSVWYLVLTHFKALEKITFQPLGQGCTVQHSGTDTLLEYESKYEIEPIERVDVDMMNLLGLSNLKYSTQTLMLYKIHRLHGWNAERHVIQVFFSLDLYNTHTHTHRDTFFLITYTCSSTLLMFWFPWCIGTVWIQHIQYISSWELWCSSLWLV